MITSSDYCGRAIKRRDGVWVGTDCIHSPEIPRRTQNITRKHLLQHPDIGWFLLWAALKGHRLEEMQK